MKILIIGSLGLVGSRFVELHQQKEDLLAPNRSELDITKIESVTQYFSQHHLEVVINFAAYTNVGDGENQRDDKNGDCWKINVDGVKNLIDVVDQDKIHFVQISTDYVFSGLPSDPGPYTEDHKPESDSKKVTWYGYTKAEAERADIEKLGAKATILRLIYPVRAKFDQKLDYLRKPLRLFDQGKLYPLFTDQQVSIAFIDEIALTLEKIIQTEATGIFQASSRDTASPIELVSYLLEKARGYQGELKTNSLDEFLKTVSNPARYPKFGGLKVEETEKRLGIKFSSWREIIDKLVEQGITA